MSVLRELLATDDRRALEFFVVGLRDVSEPTVDGLELLYNASVLAHYAQVSTFAVKDVPAPASLTDVFDRFVTDPSLRQDAHMMETAGAQCLLLAGFFEGQMRRRHNIRATRARRRLLQPARAPGTSPHKAQLLSASRGFEPWRKRHRASAASRDQAYLLRPTPPLM
jgi:hypothetical protein